MGRQKLGEREQDKNGGGGVHERAFCQANIQSSFMFFFILGAVKEGIIEDDMTIL